MLTVNNLEVFYNDVILGLRGLSLDVPEGQIVALLGSNGAGKTTLLRAVTGLLEHHEAEITKGKITSGGKLLADCQLKFRTIPFDQTPLADVVRKRASETGLVALAEAGAETGQ